MTIADELLENQIRKSRDLLDRYKASERARGQARCERCGRFIHGHGGHGCLNGEYAIPVDGGERLGLSIRIPQETMTKLTALPSFVGRRVSVKIHDPASQPPIRFNRTSEMVFRAEFSEAAPKSPRNVELISASLIAIGLLALALIGAVAYSPALYCQAWQAEAEFVQYPTGGQIQVTQQVCK